MPLLEVQHVQKIYTTRFGGTSGPGPVQRELLRGGGGICGHHGGVRLRQDHPAEYPGGPGPAHRRGGATGRAGTSSAIREQDLAAFRRYHLGFVFQDFNLLDTFSLQDNIYPAPGAVGHRPTGRCSKSSRPIARSAGHHGHPGRNTPMRSPAARSSGPPWPGPSSRTPRLILADEPTGALDSRASDALLELFGDQPAAGRPF